MTGSQSGRPCREDVVHETDQAEDALFFEGSGLEDTPQVGVALAFVETVLAYPGTGGVRQICRGPAPITRQCAAAGGWVVGACSLESEPALLLQAR